MIYLTRYKKLLIAGFTVLTAVSLYFAAQLEVHHELEAFFPQGDPDLKFLKRYQKKIAPDYNFLVVAIKRSNSVFDTSFLNRVHRLTTQAQQLPFVQNASSLTSLSTPVKTPMGMVQLPVLHFKDPQQLKEDSATIMTDDRWRNRFITKDAQVLTLIIETKPKLTQKQAEKVNNKLKQLLSDFNFSDVHIAGKSNVQSVIVNKIEGEIIKFTIIGIIVLMIILFLIYRTVWGVLIPLLSVLVGLLTFLGILGLLGRELTLISSMFPTLMLIVGMSDVIHILNKYIGEMQEGKGRKQAMRITLREIGWATLLTSVTTAIGFCALLTSKLIPVRFFGLTAAFGVLWAYLTVLLFAVPLLLHFDASQLAKGNVHEKLPRQFVAIVQRLVFRRPRRIIMVSLLLTAGALVGAFYIKTNTHLLTDIPKQTTVYQDFQFFDQHMGGGRTLEIAILPQSNYKVDDRQVLIKTQKLVNYLEEKPQINALMSPPMLFKSIHQALKGGQRKYYVFPQDSAVLQQCRTYLKKVPKRSIKRLMSEHRKIGRISGKVRDLGSAKIAMLNDTINHWINTHIDTSVVQFRHTGTSLVVDHNNKYLRKSLFSGLTIAFLIIGVGIGLLLRSYKMALVSYIPNILPLLIAGGVMGLAGITLKASTAIIFTVAYGIAVDDTIHFLTRFRLERQNGHTVDQSIIYTLLGTGKAILLTSIILLVGFGTLFFSDFTTTQQEGLLICVTLFSAVIGDLFLLPVCIRRIKQE